MRNSLIVILLGMLSALGHAQAADLGASGACTSLERWSYGSGIEPATRKRFEKLLFAQVPPMQGFAEGLALARSGASAKAKLFGEYWKNRALLQGELASAALDGFSAIAASDPNAETIGVQLAAIDCINRIHERYPALPLPAEMRTRLAQIRGVMTPSQPHDPLWTLTVNLILEDLARDSSRSSVSSLASLLSGSGAYEAFGRGFIAAEERDHSQTIAALEKTLGRSDIDERLPQSLVRHLPHARLVLARAYYSTGQFERATAQYNLLPRSSNETPEMLSELSWSYLMSERYADAVGVATNLQVGHMRGTFTPEAPVVMAMSLNELCQYPDSLRAVQLFRRDYQAAYEWLTSWGKSPKQPLYPLAIQYLQKRDKRDQRPEQVPERVAGEWVRSTLFISHQEEIHRLFGEHDKAKAFVDGGTQSQNGLARDIRSRASGLNVGVREEQGGLLGVYNAEKVPAKKAADLAELRSLVDQYNHLRDAAEYLQPVLAELDTRAGAIREQLVQEINANLARRSARMLKQLEDTAENSKLVEVEIYNGASHDMIWRNAHPDYAAVEKKMKVAYSRPKGGTLNWGTVDPSNQKVEIWEDELGAFKANLHDNCSSKERYLALKSHS